MNKARYLRIVIKNVFIVLIAILAIETYKTRNMLRDTARVTEKYQRVALLKKGFIDLSAKTEKPKILYFFAPWCPVCKQVSSNFKAVEGEADIVAVALSWESVEDVTNFIDSYSDGSYPVALGSNNLAADFRIESFPSFYFLDKDGNYSSSSATYLTSFGIWWRVQLAKLF